MQLNTRDKEIIDAILTMGLGRLDPERYPTDEVNALIYKALRFLKEEAHIDESKKVKKNNESSVDFEIWHGMHGDLKMPKGLFDKIYEEASEEDDGK